MNQHPVAELRDLQAARNARRQYKKAERLHRGAGNDLMAGGWFGLAGSEFRLADSIEAHGEAETRLPVGR